MNYRSNVIFIICILSIAFSKPWGKSHHGKMDHGDVEMLKKWKLIEFLELEESQSDAFFLHVSKFQKEMKALRSRERELFQSIENSIDENKLTKNMVDTTSKEYFKIENEKVELRRNHHKDVGEVLNPSQLAKYIIFDHHFKKRIKDHFKGKKGRPHQRRF
jgi:hypothetical protein